MKALPNPFLHMLRGQYKRTMQDAYLFARTAASEHPGGHVLDCGSGSGHEREATFGRRTGNAHFHYLGLEWSSRAVEKGRSLGLEIREADLNCSLPVETESQDCVIAFSVIEHLLMPCSFLVECRRVLKPGGRLVILTPNISTYFTAWQILRGRMPSSGPHPDSHALVELDQPPKVTELEPDVGDAASDRPVHRHLVVFSLKSLREFLRMTGFNVRESRGFGYYPFPIWAQKIFERIDKNHCHQIVLVCDKPG